MITIIQLLPYFLSVLICGFIYKKIIKNLDKTRSNNVNEIFAKHLGLVLAGIVLCGLVFFASHVTTQSITQVIQKPKQVMKVPEFEYREIKIKSLDMGITKDEIDERNSKSFDAMNRVREINKAQ